MDDNRRFGELLSNNSYEDYIKESSVSVDVSPFDSLQCPADAVQVNLLYYPEQEIDLLLYSTTDKIMISKVFPIIIVIGILGNSAFLLTLIRVRQMRTLINFYLANLAFADLCLVIVTTANYFYRFIWSSEFMSGTPWKYAPSCAILAIATYVPYFASICLVTLVSIERFLAICFPLKHRMMNNKSRTIKMVFVTWLIAFALAAIVAPQSSVFYRFCIVWPVKWQHRLPAVFSRCYSVKTEFFDISSVAQFVPFIIALLLNTTLYFLIVRRLSQRDVRDTHNMGDNQAQNQAQKVRNAVARMLVINGIAFFLCLTPFQFYNVYYLAVRNTNVMVLDDRHVYIIAWVGRCFTVFNSAINPFIYSATNARYRQAFITAIGCIPKKTQHQRNMTTSV
ncbi:type-1 angiotensin II receptor B-like [Amphiura filiformis]|uniref:type-1 angiotensin II receptor B-like n=1 Tax=Amphiura filiformis TaxID=82378 RepID=UPI003B21FAC8